MNGSANQAKYQTSSTFQPIVEQNSRIITNVTTPITNSDSDIGPPQPPQRNHLRSSLIRNNTIQSPVTIIDNNSNKNTINTLNNATHEVAKLVYKTVGTGSIQNLSNSESIQNNRNLSVCILILFNILKNFYKFY
jgi:hypothetical protein